MPKIISDINIFRRTKALESLLAWAETVMEFFDSFEASYEDDELANEALTLQSRGLQIGLSRKAEITN